MCERVMGCLEQFLLNMDHFDVSLYQIHSLSPAVLDVILQTYKHCKVNKKIHHNKNRIMYAYISSIVLF